MYGLAVMLSISTRTTSKTINNIQFYDSLFRGKFTLYKLPDLLSVSMYVLHDLAKTVIN